MTKKGVDKTNENSTSYSQSIVESVISCELASEKKKCCCPAGNEVFSKGDHSSNTKFKGIQDTQFRVIEELGMGVCSRVFKVMEVCNSQEYAMKMIPVVSFCTCKGRVQKKMVERARFFFHKITTKMDVFLGKCLTVSKRKE
ncbi:hypothetical protein RFI_09993 [Reticulomyxa filosa]|uniref:Protein kinase domain-containing protein n=1 Tax=Reticulomyxa filosa TaxID=46433 RepID=X6NM98_RETFI|nr:hypothetical protein RFI_09993 [Reticulomyxa filosa]|eukprot:ETO27141.1 hypothetical protein RFI_09993 [Reticulomyxa filosa]